MSDKTWDEKWSEHFKNQEIVTDLPPVNNEWSDFYKDAGVDDCVSSPEELTEQELTQTTNVYQKTNAEAYYNHGSIIIELWYNAKLGRPLDTHLEIDPDDTAGYDYDFNI